MPITFEVEFQIPRVNPLISTLITGDLVVVSREWANDVRGEARKYPPERAGQRYVRTNRLKNGWMINGPVISGSDIVTRVDNATRYTRFVHGDERGSGQSWFHQGRWKRLLEIGVSVRPLQQRAQLALNKRVGQAFVQETIRIS